MGRFNPSAPQILGQEWVPIRDEFYVPDYFRESGYQFTTTATQNLTTAKWYTVPDLQDIAAAPTPGAGVSSELGFQVNLYRAGTQTLTGPIQRLLIPVMSGTVAGDAFILGGTVQDALSGKGGSSIFFDFGNGILNVYFNTTAFASVLNNKRILRVNFLVSASESCTSTDFAFLQEPVGEFLTLGQFDLTDNYTVPANETGTMWNTLTTVTNEHYELHAWRYSTLSRLSTVGPTPRIHLRVVSDGGTSGCFLDYLVMEVFYCEETRVAEGGRRIGTDPTNQGALIGGTQVIMRDSSFGYPVSIPAGDYVVTLGLSDFRGNAGFVS